MFISAKFRPCSLQSHTLSRPALLEKLENAENYALTLIIAPAGFGKSYVLSMWLKNCPNATYVSLDEEDNDPIRFGKYIEYALFSTCSPFQHLKNHFATLLARLEKTPITRYLILDHFHFIRSPQILKAMDFWLKNQSTHFSVILISRTKPALNLSLLRLQEQLQQISIEDCRLTLNETQQFLAQRLPQLNKNQLITLRDSFYSQSRGWITACQLGVLYHQHAIQSQSAHTLCLDLYTPYLEDLSKMNEGELLLVKKKYRKDISDRSLEELYSNKEYTILIKK